MSGAATRDRLAGLSREQRALLFEQIRSRKERETPPVPGIPRRPPDLDPVPASYAQERLWFMDRLAPGNSFYNVPLALRIEGEASPAVLAAVLGEVVRRHEALRTTFAESAGKPAQVISPPGGWVLRVIDLSGLAEAARRCEAARLAQEEADRPFHLETGPLLRAVLLRLGAAEHALLLSIHHIVSDGWSMGVLVREITALYGAAVAGTPPRLPPLPIQYADFAVWQRGWLQGEVLQDQLDFWRQRLSGAPVSLDLPADRPRPATATYRGARLRRKLDGDFARGLAFLARRHGASLYMALLAGFQALLGRLVGQEDLTIGSPIANRHRSEVEPLIGFFVNTLVMRGDLGGGPTFAELLARVRRSTLEAYAHQDLPFERLVEELRPERHLALNPLFQAVCALQSSPVGRMELPGLAISPLELAATTSQFDLELNAWEAEDSFLVLLVYSTELFDPSTVQRFAGQLETLLRGAMADPGRPVAELPLLAEGERHQLLAEWNDTGATQPPRLALDRFAGQVARAPDAVALEAAGERLTYGELDRLANRLAHRLRRLGVGPGVPVGLFAERSPAMVAGLLAVWKAGGAYLPLDPGHPEARLSYLLEDSQAPVVVTSGSLAGILPSCGAGQVLLDGDDLEGESGLPPEGTPEPGDLACLIYTSGTTGRPKAVLVEHANLASTLEAVQEAFGFQPDDRMPSIAAFSFDIFLFELLGPLLAGGTCVLVPLRPALDLERLAGELETATLFHAVPAVMRQVVGLARRLGAAAPALRALFTGGDAVPADLLADLGEVFPRARRWVLYGPTEATIVCTFWPVPAAVPARSLLGRPFAGAEIRVCDAAGPPAPVGVPGEIWIGGAGVARGYRRRQELTAEKFVAVDGRRFFRSGDLARWLPAGTLEFLGRADQQVKVRGFRIELGEIEAWLVRHPAVREAAAAVREAPVDGKQLVAYVVRRTEEATAEELRRFLQAELPDYMVPQALVFLDRLPLTVHGKVDRAALPAPEPPPAGVTPPRTPGEKAMAELWQEVLGLARVGREDNFFALGGHSLLATQLVSRVRAVFGIDLPLRLVFEQPILGELVAALGAAVPLVAPRARAGRPQTESPLSFAQERQWFVERLTPGTAAFNIPLPLMLRGPLDPGVLERAFAEVRRRQASLRTRFEEREGSPVQVIDPSEPWWLPRVDLDGLPALLGRREAERLAAEDAGRPFDLARGPLFRPLLARLAAAEHLLLATCHHIISDGWSFGVLIQEVTAHYAAFLAGGPPPLPELPLQYAEHAVQQRERLAGPALGGQLAYWRENLAGAPPLLDLPLDRPRPALQTYRGERIIRTLPPDLVAALKAVSLAEKASLYMTLLAALALLLHRWSGQDEVVVGSPVAGRGQHETEGIIGLFLNLLPMRIDLSGRPAFRDLLRLARRAALGAFAHQDAPFERVIQELRPNREPSYTPVFQVLLNMLNLPLAAGELPGGTTVEGLELGQIESKYDFTLYAAEAADGLALDLVYNPDLFDPERMEELLRQLAALLAQVARDPDRPVASLSLLTPEAAAVLPDPSRPLGAEWRGAVHELFLAAARREPDRPAVVDPQASWTYGELADAVGRLAAHLRVAGVAPGDRVAIWAHRSAPVAWAVLGTLAAGGAFVLLDPAYPAARLAEILRLAEPRAWLALAAAGAPPGEVEELLAGWEAAGRLLARVVLPARGPQEAAGLLARFPPAGEPAAAGPDDLAFVAFTSGSTGSPKGILGRHGPLSHFLPWQRERFGLTREDRYSLLSGLAHDPLQRDLFTALTTGASLHAPDPEEIFVPGRLASWAARQGITVAHLTPALGQVLTEPPGDGSAAATIPTIPTLRYVLLVGDVLTRLDVDRLRRLAPGVTCVNLYGSTETQRAVGYHVVDAGDGGAGQRARQVLPLGRGMDGVQILVLKPGERLAGIGELGEIWMRSPHLARGYLGDEALTRERFRANPFTGREEDRVYRTGDLGRYLPNGEAVFAGRVDHQVKIRGYRIEPGEVEATVGRLAGIRDSVVVVREERGERYLAAYVVAEPGAEPGLAARLRPFLAARLPDYMVPAVFVELPALPLTPNGKVDRRALPAPRRELAAGAAPRNPVEEELAGLWAELLGLGRVGVHDNFFELGGHSLLATRLVSRIRGAFAVELPLRAIFEAPTVAELAARIEGERASAGVAAAPIRPVPRDRPLPLSFAQERLWFLHLLAPDSPAYNMGKALRLIGRLDVGALSAALSEILRRHEALRTTFRATATGAVQEIQPWQPLPQPAVDLAALPEEVRRGEAKRLAEEEGARPFDLAQGPLLRALLLRLGAQDHIALWTTHHVTADGWSLVEVFIPELTRLYASFAEGLPSPLPLPPVQYADYAVWQREQSRGEVLAEQLEYWRRQLIGLAPLELPADRPRPPVPSGRGGSRIWELPAGRLEPLGRLARGGDATLFMALFAGLAAVLHRETGASQLPVGMPVANRSRGEIEGLIGFFVNTLVLRGDLAGDPDFPRLLARSRDAVLGALSHQDIPFERLVDELALPRNPHRPPLLRVVVQLRTASAAGSLELPGLTLEPFEADVDAAKFDLVLELVEVAGRVGGAFRYDSDLFDATTIARLAERFTTLLVAWSGEPDRRLSDLQLLSAAERHQLLVEWNPAPIAAVDRGASSLHRLFEAQVDRAPEAAAVSARGERLTYRELDRRANQLARHLRAAGARPGDRIAPALERSADLVVAILAILKTGAAYVPLDPAHPGERLAFMLADSGVSLLVAVGPLASVPSGAARVVRLDAERQAIERRSGERLTVSPTSAGADLPAYVIYTSGSTGRPKGVVITHANVERLFRATEPWFGFGAADVWTQFHSYAFDFSVWEIWGALLYGGRLVVVPYWESRSPEGFYRLLRDERVTVLNQTPSAFRQLLWAEEAALGGGAHDLALRWVIFGGEALEPASLAPWFARHGDERPRLANMYGITETTVHATWRPVRAADLGVGSLIGQPIPDLTLHLLDGGRPVPIGVAGEIHVGGAGLASGYLGRPDLTAERFVPDPFAAAPGARLYRSGDLARRLPNGDLEYLGRVDQQVKIRGFRIELGEIEATLAAQPGVREAAVLARDDGPGGERRLVAYVTGWAEEAADPSALRRSLAERLPDYLLPAAFVFLDALPLTANGKIDRRALPAPEAAGAAPAKVRIPPRTALERFLVLQFRDVLGLPADREIGVEEDFFALGGTSITSAILIHRLQEALGEIVHVVTIFDHPTASALAEQVRERHGEAARRLEREDGTASAPVAPERGVLVPLQTGSAGRRPLFCVHSVGGEVVSYRELARRLGAGQPVYGLQSPDPPLDDVREMAELYVSAVREAQPTGPYRLCGWSMGGIVAYEMARQLEAQDERTEVLAVIDAASPARWTGEAERSDAEMVILFATALEQLHGRDLDLPPGFELPALDLSALDTDAALAVALDLGRQVGLLSPSLELPDLRRLFVRFQANRRSLASYQPHPYGGELHLFRAAEHPARIGEEADPTLGWGKLLNGGLQVFDVPGDHRTVLKVGVEALAGRLRELLER